MAAAILPIDSSGRYAAYFAAVSALPFTQELKKPVHRIDMWAVTPTGDHMQDERFGVSCALAALDILQARRDQLLLQNILATMVSKGRVSPIEVAFLEIIDKNAHGCLAFHLL